MNMPKGTISYELTPEKLNPDLLNYISNVGEKLVVQHYLCWSSIAPDLDNLSPNNTLLNNIYRSKSENYLKYITQKDYENAIWIIEKPARLLWFDENYIKIYNDIGEKRYYRLLAQVLIGVEFHYYSKNLYNKLISAGNNPHLMMNKKEKNYFDSLPETITIYRGINSETEFNSDKVKDYLGFSWTLDKTKAEWFAKRWSSRKYRILLTTSISKSQATSCLLDKNEKEIWIDFKELNFELISVDILK